MESKYMHFGGNSKVLSLDDIAGHNVYRDGDELWHFDINKYLPDDFQTRHGGNINHTGIFDSLFNPFILLLRNPAVALNKNGGTIPQVLLVPIEYNKLDRYKSIAQEEPLWWLDIDANSITDAFNPYQLIPPETYNEPQSLSVEEPLTPLLETHNVTTNFNPETLLEFVSVMGKVLSGALTEHGLSPDIWTPILLSHIAIESGWGKSSLATKYNNFGGVKGNDTSPLNTKEWSLDRGYYTIQDTFKKFDSVELYADYYVERLKNEFHAFDGTPELYLLNIRQYGYFTAPLSDYSKTFSSVLQKVLQLWQSH